MDAQWIKSPAGRRVLEHWADPRPSWLWLSDGQTLLWRNITARAFHGKAKSRHGSQGGEAVPIRGQIPRLIRLGSFNRASLARLQFLSGDRPISATCACTPLQLPGDQTGLLIVNVDPVPLDELQFPLAADGALEALFPPGSDYLLVDDDTQFANGSPRALERFAPVIESEGLPPLDAEGHGVVQVDGRAVGFTRFRASPQDASLLLFDQPASTEAVAAPGPTPAEAAAAEPMLPMGLPPTISPEPPEQPPMASADEYWVEPLHEPAPVAGGLSSLFDRLMDDSALFAPLRPDEEFSLPPVPPRQAAAGAAPLDAVAATVTGDDAGLLQEMKPAEPEAELHPLPEPTTLEAAAEHPVEASAEAPETEIAMPAGIKQPEPQAAPEPALAVPEAAAEPAIPSASEEPAPAVAPRLYRIIGRSFTPIAASAAAPVVPPPEAEPEPESQAAGAADAPLHSSIEGLLQELDIERETAPTALPEEHAAAPDDPATGAPAIEAMAELEEAAAPASPSPQPPAAEAPALPVEDGAESQTSEAMERASRYNFDELSRILSDRIGMGERGPIEGPGQRNVAFSGRPPAPSVPSATPEGALVTLGGETLVLNRLPLGILVFRDQQVLFANRAITEMIGYESVESLRNAGLASIFPAAGDEKQEAGPVNHLVQRDGMLVPVTARLQSVSWQGKPALMLSASATEVRTGHEAAVRAFAELLAGTRSDGFIETSRTGLVTHASGAAQLVLELAAEQIIGRPITQFVAPDETPALKAFLERPARFAETARPAITFRGNLAGTELLLFAQGQAGTVSGYFGFVRRRETPLVQVLGSPQNEGDPGLLERLSRGVRRPLNTVIGFSDLIGSAAFGPIDNQRYLEYARDIKTAGLEIAALVDELDDFARLRDGRYTSRPTDIDLAALLESSVTRVRGQANAARVLVRSAISERLPRVRADRASLAQAVLNLLASAIDQTPQDGSVVLSAQVDDAGGVTIHVRDSSPHPADIAERFVVFRDGAGRDGEMLTPVQSSVGLALTRALLAVNAATLVVEPTAGTGMLFSLTLPPENVVIASQVPAGNS